MTWALIRLDLGRHNFLLVDGQPYFLYRASSGKLLALDGRCPHRGGPLHLGRFDPADGCLVCPWHGTRLRETALPRQALPMVRVGSAVTVLAPHAGKPEVVCQQRIVLADGRPPPAGAAPAEDRRH